jgi:hypothetical protein
LDSAALRILDAAATLRTTRDRLGLAETPESDSGLLLVALASSSGAHLRILDNSTALACAARSELGLARWHHQLVLACAWPKFSARRVRMRVDAGARANGRVSRWGFAWIASEIAGASWAITVAIIVIGPTVALYLSSRSSRTCCSRRSGRAPSGPRAPKRARGGELFSWNADPHTLQQVCHRRLLRLARVRAVAAADEADALFASGFSLSAVSRR